ncbi:MAG TPA: SHOCT domain-containing protein [Nocardioidaceae bacterium]|jgi:putative membrane protein
MSTITDTTSAMTSLAAQHAPAVVTFAANGPGDGDGPGWWVIFPITWLLVVATVITVVVLGVRRRGRLSGRRAGERRLAERYASGEIDESEYRARLATLRQIGSD